MLNKNYSVYLGKERPDSFSGFIVDEHLILVLKVDEGLSKENGREILKDISENIRNKNIKGLEDFEHNLSGLWRKYSIPSHFSYIAAFQKDSTLYLKTSGTGEVFLRRNKDFVKIIGNENKASGFIEDNDFFVFTTEEFINILEGEEKLRETFNNKNPHEILEELTPVLKGKDDTSIIALFVKFEKTEKETIENGEEESDNIPRTNILKEKIIKSLGYIVNLYKDLRNKKPIRLFVAGTISLLFVLSLIYGYQERAGKTAFNKIKTTRETVQEKLNQAEDVSEINLSRAIALLGDARKDVSELKKQLKGKNQSDIRSIDEMIYSFEVKILKSEEKKHQEFFDLSIENKNAKGIKIAVYKESAVILDNKGYVYIFSLTKKSLDKRKSSLLSKAKSVSMYEDSIYFLTPDGVYSIDEKNKTKKIVSKDKDWKGVSDIISYAGNIYLLDNKASRVYKYISTEQGFSQKNDYFARGQEVDLEKALSFAIDSSLYIGFSQSIMKFTSGLRDGFSTSYPKEKINVAKIYTDQECENIYALSKIDGILYILSKTGSYEKQIKSSIFKTASDFVVYNKSAFLILGSKIYKVELE